MSVHGEYARALESLIACVRALGESDRDGWLGRLEQARVERNPDLSAAARQARETLRDLAGIDSESPRVAEASMHLLAHCRLILGAND